MYFFLKKIPIIFLSVLAFSILTGCNQTLIFSYTDIGEIAKASKSYEGREVKLRGVVGDQLKVPFLDLKGYLLKDNTGTIVVLTSNDLPTVGENVVVRGRVENLLILASFNYGLTLKEIERSFL